MSKMDTSGFDGVQIIPGTIWTADFAKGLMADARDRGEFGSDAIIHRHGWSVDNRTIFAIVENPLSKTFSRYAVDVGSSAIYRVGVRTPTSNVITWDEVQEYRWKNRFE